MTDLRTGSSFPVTVFMKSLSGYRVAMDLPYAFVKNQVVRLAFGTWDSYAEGRVTASRIEDGGAVAEVLRVPPAVGALKRYPLARLFLDHVVARSTGTLILHHQGTEVAAVFDAGRLCSASSTRHRLLAPGRLPRLAELLHHGQPGTHCVDPRRKTIRQLLAAASEHMVSSVFTWEDGFFEFYPLPHLLPEHTIFPQGLNLPRIVALGMRRASENLLRPHLSGLDRFFVPSETPYGPETLGYLQPAERDLLDRICRSGFQPDEGSVEGAERAVFAGALAVLVGLGLVETADSSSLPAGDADPPQARAPVPETTSAKPDVTSEEIQGLWEDVQGANLYGALKLERAATTDEVKKRFQELARRYHPDLHHGLPRGDRERLHDVFMRYLDAYTVLSKDRKRQDYDKNLAAGTLPRGTTGPDAARVYQQGMEAYRRGDFAAAVHSFQWAREAEPKNPSYAFGLAKALQRAGAPDKDAETAFLAAIEIDSFNVDYRNELARMYLDNGMGRRANKTLRDVLLIDPQNDQALAMLARLVQHA